MAVSKIKGFHDAVEIPNTRECADSRNEISESAIRGLTQEEMEKLGGEVLVSDFKQIKLEKEAQKNWDLFYKRNTTNFFKDRHWTTREFEELKACREVSNENGWKFQVDQQLYRITLFVFQNSLEKTVSFKRDGLNISHQWHWTVSSSTSTFQLMIVVGWGLLCCLCPVWCAVWVPEAGAAGGRLWCWKLHLPSAAGRPQPLCLRLRLLTSSCWICQGLVCFLKLTDNSCIIQQKKI